jgi:hypothetical protein
MSVSSLPFSAVKAVGLAWTPVGASLMDKSLGGAGATSDRPDDLRCSSIFSLEGADHNGPGLRLIETEGSASAAMGLVR